MERGGGDRGPVAGGFTEPSVGPVVLGVLVKLPTPAEDCPALARMLSGRAYYPR